MKTNYHKWEIAERCNMVERLFNLKEGLTREDLEKGDMLNHRYFDEPTRRGAPDVVGRTIDRKKFAKMVDEFYEHKGLAQHFKGQQPVVGFSALAGRPDLFELARELKQEGAITLLAGPRQGRTSKAKPGAGSIPIVSRACTPVFPLHCMDLASRSFPF